MLDQRTPLPDIVEACEGTEYEPYADCIQTTFDRMGITTVYDLDNSPRQLTCYFCGVNTHGFITFLRGYIESYEAAIAAAMVAVETVSESEEE